MSSRLSPEWVCVNSYTWAHDVRLPCYERGKIFLTFSAKTNNFLEKLKKLEKVLLNSVLVTGDVARLYCFILQDSGLITIWKVVRIREINKIRSIDLVDMVKIALNSNWFESYFNAQEQVSGTSIGKKYSLPHACIFMEKVEIEFLQSEENKSWI